MQHWTPTESFGVFLSKEEELRKREDMSLPIIQRYTDGIYIALRPLSIFLASNIYAWESWHIRSWQPFLCPVNKRLRWQRHLFRPCLRTANAPIHLHREPIPSPRKGLPKECTFQGCFKKPRLECYDDSASFCDADSPRWIPLSAIR
jgi:hypothetical protein